MQEQQIEELEKTISRGRDYWLNIIDEWSKSNESQKTFCKRLEIKLATFTYWRGIFAKENKPKENKFIALKITERNSERLAQFIIKCPSGHEMTFLPGNNLEQTQQVLKLLGVIHA